MSEQKSTMGWDLVWFVAARASAVMLVVMAVLIVMERSEHESKSEALAVAVHRAYVEEDMRSHPLQRLAAASSSDGSR